MDYRNKRLRKITYQEPVFQSIDPGEKWRYMFRSDSISWTKWSWHWERKLEEKYGLTKQYWSSAVPAAYEQSSDQEVAFQAVDYILRVSKTYRYLEWHGKSHAWICGSSWRKMNNLRSLSASECVKVVPILGSQTIQSDSWNTTTYSNTCNNESRKLLHCASYNFSLHQCLGRCKEKSWSKVLMKSPSSSYGRNSGHCIDRNRIDAGRFFDIKAEIRTKGRNTKELTSNEEKELLPFVGERRWEIVEGFILEWPDGWWGSMKNGWKWLNSLDKIAKIESEVGMSYGKDKIKKPSNQRCDRRWISECVGNRCRRQKLLK